MHLFRFIHSNNGYMQVVQNIIVREGFYIVRSSLTHWKVEDARQFYAEHKGMFHNSVSVPMIQWNL